MDKISKALKKITAKEREAVKALLLKIISRDFNNLDIKKLKGREDIYRVRKGKIRIIFRIENKEKLFVLAIERRNDNTYN